MSQQTGDERVQDDAHVAGAVGPFSRLVISLDLLVTSDRESELAMHALGMLLVVIKVQSGWFLWKSAIRSIG
jgi:hypothetical protein